MDKEVTNKMNLIKKVCPYVLALGFGALTLTGCSTMAQVVNDFEEQIRSKKYTSLEKAKRVLNTNQSYAVEILPKGYITLKALDSRLKTLAGIYAGTIELKKTKQGYCAKGFYSEYTHPGALLKVLKEADTNKDRIITSQEVRNLERKILKETRE